MTADLHCFKLDYRITNIANKELVVKVKNGLSYIIRRSEQATYRTEQMVYVNLENVYLENLQVDPEQALTKMDKAILQAIKDEQTRQMTGRNEVYYKNLTNNIGVKIALGQSLVERNNAIHSELLGITLYIGGENLDQPCLNTPGFTLQELFKEHDEAAGTKNCLSYFIYVNDPLLTFKTLYTNVLGKSVEVPVDDDKNKLPGLYIGISRGIEPRETPYYTFASLDDKTLEQLGLFKSKAACDEGGNTERYLTAETRSKELSKEVAKSKETLENLTELLAKSEIVNSRLGTDLSKSREDHKTEVTRLKYEHNLETTQLKHQSKMSSDIFKYETRVKDTVNKANFDMVKQKSSYNSWGDFAKAVGTLAGVAFTGYKLLTS